MTQQVGSWLLLSVLLPWRAQDVARLVAEVATR
jgi:hypothetical protein